jgi:hypothetical protein
MAFGAGAREGRFAFADHDAVRREFAEAGIRTAPRIEAED